MDFNTEVLRNLKKEKVIFRSSFLAKTSFYFEYILYSLGWGCLILSDNFSLPHPEGKICIAVITLI